MTGFAEELDQVVKGSRGRLVRWYAYIIATSVFVGIFFPLSGISVRIFRQKEGVHYVQPNTEGP